MFHLGNSDKKRHSFVLGKPQLTRKYVSEFSKVKFIYLTYMIPLKLFLIACKYYKWQVNATFHMKNI